ncbi:urease accessory protein UreF [Haloarchaeobius salinus]|uniref:urease accessory protein UreF n=1 Tax=Haloarchaeobius salinus TaxID=1198298 RepID=UPI00210D382D|nr:urease accessory UreF family protein [Haloarchaeobius salinus]
MTDVASLSAFRLADSFLPIGTDSVSYALEQFVAEDRVTDAADLEALLATYLRRLLGPCELVALRAAHAATLAADIEDVYEADRRLTATTLPAEFRESAERAGDRLLTVQRDLRDDPRLDRYGRVVDRDDSPGNFPVVLGVVTAVDGIDERTACALCCHGFLTGQVGAAQRLMSLGHSDAQRVLDALQPVVVQAIDDSEDRSLDEMTPFAPLVDVLSATHERADRRLFLS